MQKRYKQLAKGLLMAVAFSCVGCSAGGESTALEYLPNMMDTPAVKAQTGRMLTPPEGTLPIGGERYPFTKENGDAATNLQNPVARKREIFLQGKELFETYCAVCHGDTGKGDGYIVPKFPRPPSLHSDKVREWTDGRLFHVITKGQNLMPGYATKLHPEERWKVIHYLRALQRAVHPTQADIDKLRSELGDDE